MKKKGTQIGWLIATIWAFSLVLGFAGNGDPATVKSIDKEDFTYSESEVRSRFKQMPSIVTKRYSGLTKSRIKTYVDSRRDITEELLGKSSMFFPIIEQYLKAYNLPLDLRVLPIIETKMDPTAISHAGASGLWQFMEGTAAEYGLTIDHLIDERFDIHRSTEAAVQYLAKLYNKYEDWGLALAAYNCGPGYVNRAIRRAKSRDYWSIARYLPRETQKYVPKFLAATYLVNYYHEHGLIPVFPDLDLQITQELRVFKAVCFDEIARIAQVPLPIVRQLNPAYTEDCLKAKKVGTVITLPKRSVRFVAGYLQMPEEGHKYFEELTLPELEEESLTQAGYRLVLYVPAVDSTLTYVADLFGVEESLLRLWNALEPEPKFDGIRELQIFVPEIKPFHLPKPAKIELIPQIGTEIATALSKKYQHAIVDLMYGIGSESKYDLYTLNLADTPEDVCRAYPTIDPQDLKDHNPKALWVPGEIIRVPHTRQNLAVR
ncbi:MAG: lytic transglycosylase domain-containing protein [Saprospiraceae bacterium]|nr:lytic transglycosylase domain-containing protein [Saprospiraceae bacterium]